MTLQHDRRLGGMLYVPPTGKNQPRKHDCPDCHACQFCGDDRCGVCRCKVPHDKNTPISPGDKQKDPCSR